MIFALYNTDTESFEGYGDFEEEEAYRRNRILRYREEPVRWIRSDYLEVEDEV